LLSAESTVYSGDWSGRENKNGPVHHHEPDAETTADRYENVRTHAA